MSLRRGVAGTTPHRSASVWMPFARSLTSNLVREQGGAANATEAPNRDGRSARR